MDFTEAYDDTNTSVGLCARSGNAIMLQELLQNGHPSNGHDNRGYRPLHEAAEGGHVECVRILLTADDVDVDAQTHDGVTALHLACLNGQNFTHVIKLLLSAGADPNMQAGDDWILPLPKAVIWHNTETVKLLLAAGADPNRKDYSNGTPLHTAAERGLLEIAQLLIENGADVNWKDEGGRTALHILLFPPIVDATLVSFIDLLVDKGCDVNAVTEDFTTPLMLAVQANLEHAVTRLLDCKADPNIRKINGVIALHYAVEFCPEPSKSTDKGKEGNGILKKLIDLSSSFICPKKPQRLNYSIYHLAVEWQRYTALKMLVEAKIPADMFLQETADAALDEADVNLFDQVPLVVDLGFKFDTPLGFILSKPLTPVRVKIAKLMIDEGSSANPVVQGCLPPLAAAVKHQRRTYDDKCIGNEIVTHLLKNGANILHKMHSNDPIPVSLFVSSLFNPSAFFTLLRWGIPVHEIYNPETLRRLCICYEVKLLYKVYPLFPWRVISWLTILNMFMPQLPHYTRTLFDRECLVMDDHLSAAWDTFETSIETPKDLQSLSVLAVRKAIGESQGWADMSSSLEKLQFAGAPIPQLIMDRLQFKQVERKSLYICPPWHVMPMYSVKLQSDDDDNDNAGSRQSNRRRQAAAAAASQNTNPPAQENRIVDPEIEMGIRINEIENDLMRSAQREERRPSIPKEKSMDEIIKEIDEAVGSTSRSSRSKGRTKRRLSDDSSKLN